MRMCARICVCGCVLADVFVRARSASVCRCVLADAVVRVLRAPTPLANPPLGKSATNLPLGFHCLKEKRSLLVVIVFQACEAFICTCDSSNSNGILRLHTKAILLIHMSAHYAGADDRVRELRGGQ